LLKRKEIYLGSWLFGDSLYSLDDLKREELWHVVIGSFLVWFPNVSWDDDDELLEEENGSVESSQVVKIKEEEEFCDLGVDWIVVARRKLSAFSQRVFTRVLC
jgi:hypothetical protein